MNDAAAQLSIMARLLAVEGFASFACLCDKAAQVARVHPGHRPIAYLRHVGGQSVPLKIRRMCSR